MIVGAGVDVVPIQRFARRQDPSGFLEQVFTDDELAAVPGGAAGADVCARLFAVKEAVVKALGCGMLQGFPWHDIAVADGYRVQLSGRVRELAAEHFVSAIHVTHSSSATLAVAFVLLETNKP